MYCAQVGWFLHTPFPSSEIYRTLPVREEVLRAVLKSDLIGFHTYDYARHFVSACTRILGLEVTCFCCFHHTACMPAHAHCRAPDARTQGSSIGSAHQGVPTIRTQGNDRDNSASL
jgi:trehalose-6-phosphate synthase